MSYGNSFEEDDDLSCGIQKRRSEYPEPIGSGEQYEEVLDAPIASIQFVGDSEEVVLTQDQLREFFLSNVLSDEQAEEIRAWENQPTPAPGKSLAFGFRYEVKYGGEYRTLMLYDCRGDRREAIPGICGGKLSRDGIVVYTRRGSGQTLKRVAAVLSKILSLPIRLTSKNRKH